MIRYDVPAKYILPSLFPPFQKSTIRPAHPLSNTILNIGKTEREYKLKRMRMPGRKTAHYLPESTITLDERVPSHYCQQLRWLLPSVAICQVVLFLNGLILISRLRGRQQLRIKVRSKI